MPKTGWLILTILLLFALHTDATPIDTARLTRTLGVTQGLPQSFISGLVQDEEGFIWIATRDGLARYDGRRFKLFNYQPNDSNTLSNNTITNLHYDRNGWLWIFYETGQLDRLHTATEQLQHLTGMAAYAAAGKALKANVTAVKSFAEDSKGRIWQLGKKGLFIFDIAHNRLQAYSNRQLGQPGEVIYGMASGCRTAGNKEILLALDTAFVWMDEERHVIRTIPFRFPQPWLHGGQSIKDVYPIQRRNGDIVLLDSGRLIIYHQATNAFTIKPFPGTGNVYVFSSILQDVEDNIFFNYRGTIYQLQPGDSLKIWSSTIGNPSQSQSMLLDRSGMLWIGGNGSATRLYDRRLSHLQGQPYHIANRLSFIWDVLERSVGVPASELESSFLNGLQSYYLRWIKVKTGTIWLAEGSDQPFRNHLCALINGRLQQPAWKVVQPNGSPATLQSINALALSASGKLWGLDYDFHLVAFDAVSSTAIVYPALTNKAQRANSMLIDGENIFWISSDSKGLFRYDAATGNLRQYAAGSPAGIFSSLRPTILLQDPLDTGKLWIGTMSDGLQHFDKRTGHVEIFTVDKGLPNNTVYTILPDAADRLWCSTNKGIFRFDPRTGSIYSFTAKDGLAGDEFNRQHFFSLPDGRMAFGGVDGYVVFDPATIAEDQFEPEIALTDIAINNSPADYGQPHSGLLGAINSLQTLKLPYDSNILRFEFAALEYNIPEKLQYRYRLEGIDEQWVNAGHNNVAMYTRLPPGSYTFLVNATNTAGKWSSKVKRLSITIDPPFWKTSWFIGLCIVVIVGLGWWAVHRRIASIKNKARKQLAFERKAMELEAAALRAQMNPHFVFNCLNSIKSLIHEDKKREAVLYLTTFSKLIRSQLTNAQREVTLYEELETCRLYTQLEALRFGNKITVAFHIAYGLDLHSVMVPPLLIQPFIENAIWHGILPKEAGGAITVEVKAEPGGIACSIEDNGIGRATSQLNKSKTAPTHHSKGMQLTQERLHLHSRIYNRGGHIEIIDKTDAAGAPTGTQVILHLQTDSN